MDKNSNIRFRLTEIRGDRSESFLDGKDFSVLNGDNLVFQYKVISTIIREKKEIVVTPNIRFRYKDNVLFQSCAEFVYKIDDFDDAVSINSEEGTIEVRNDLFTTMVSAAYSSLRGIVYTQLKDTPLSIYPLPLIDVRTLTEKNSITIE